MKKHKIGLVDYNSGNLGTLKIALSGMGYRCVISDSRETLSDCDVLLLPGVGAFAPAMLELRKKKLDQYLIDEVDNNKPIIGICLGMQLFGKASMENGHHFGLGIIPFTVEALPEGNSHIGWNSISMEVADRCFLEAADSDFYFNHRYAYLNAGIFTICSANQNGVNFVAALRYKNLIGLQFHPEKSQHSGITLLKQIIEDLLIV